SFYKHQKNEVKKWENTFFRIDYLPLRDRTIEKPRDLANMYFTPLVDYIKNHGGSVYIDMPHNEQFYLFLKQSASGWGLKICNDAKDTDLFFRFILYPPYEKYNYRTVVGANEKIIGTSARLINLAKIYLDIELVSIPRTDRSISKVTQINPIPFRILTGISENDFDIYLNGLTAKAKYLRILLAPGPSIDFSGFNLEVKNNLGAEMKYKISSPQTLLDIPLSKIQKEDGSLHLSFSVKNLIGKSLMPIEERFLNYSLLAAELTENINAYSPIMKEILNHKTLSDKMNYLSKYIPVQQPQDIISVSDTSFCFLGLGWYNLEYFEKQPMRWIGDKPNEVVIINDKVDKRFNLCEVDLEPGPSCDGKPLELNAYIDNQFVKKFMIEKREKIKIPLEIINLGKEKKKKPDQTIIKLESENENIKITSDPRILKYRVFHINLMEKGKKDVINIGLEKSIELKSGWYPFEKFNNETFRWIGNAPAELLVNTKKSLKNILIEAEPGPGCAGKPLPIDIYIENELVKRDTIKQRQKIHLETELLNKINKDWANLKIVTHSENLKIKSDSRILNLRVFDISTQ
ncbi:MAG: hypothetical protein ACYC6D_03305, partial [Melioribacteraceae bacterium]